MFLIIYMNNQKPRATLYYGWLSSSSVVFMPLQ